MKNNQGHITITPRGPMKIEGKCELTDYNDCLIEYSGDLYLCRCGQSRNKPFCDGIHKEINWPDHLE